MGGIGNDELLGETGPDFLFGEDGNDNMNGGDGIDRIVGGNGTDNAVFDGARNRYTIQNSQGTTLVVDTEGRGRGDTIVSSENVRFSSGNTNTGGNGTGTNTDPGSTPTPADLAEAEAASLRLLNNFRTANGLRPVTASADLTRFAENWSRTMASSGFRHSDRSDRATLQTGGRGFISENIGFNTRDVSGTEYAQLQQTAWENSPSHRANQLDATRTEVGIGLFYDGSTWWATHVFGDA